MPAPRLEPLSDSTHLEAVIFDVSDVLFTWSPDTAKSPLPAKVIKCILRSSPWFEYEKGNLSEEEAYEQVAAEFDVSVVDVRESFIVARDSPKSDPELLTYIRCLKSKGLRLLAMSNISAPDFEFLRQKASSEDWSLFEFVFTSYVILFPYHIQLKGILFVELQRIHGNLASGFTNLSFKRQESIQHALHSSTTNSKTSSVLVHLECMASFTQALKNLSDSSLVS